MDTIRVTEPRPDPPVVRPKQVDWRALSETEQAHVLDYQDRQRTLRRCLPRAKTFLKRHCGA